MKSSRPELLVAFGDRLREERITRGLSQEDLAELAGVHRTYVGMLERGEKNVTLKNLAMIANALGITVASLVQGLEVRARRSRSALLAIPQKGHDAI